MASDAVNGEIVEAQAVEVHHPPAVVPPVPPQLSVTPTVTAGELTGRLAVIRQAQEQAMVKDVDYGVIPGTDKPTLLKPGAEKLAVLFQLDVQLSNEKVWGPGEHLTVISHATVFHAPTGARLGYGEGICTTREKKYAYRNAERTCPSCGKANIRRSRQAGEGWYCWRKTDGCGATFPENDPQITSQEAGRVDNPDLPDTWNTVVKMAEKRARVDAVLAVTGASALFTQDAEDLPQSEPEPDRAPAVQVAAPARQAPQTTAREPQPSSPAATPAQKGKINVLCSKANLTENEVKAVLQWKAGTAQLDRVSKRDASKLIDLLDKDGGAVEILAEITTEADRGEPRACAIVSRYFEAAPNA